MTWEKFWSIIDRVRAQADMQDEASVKQFLYTELINLPQDELLGFDCAWQSYRNKANFPRMVAAACIINDGSSDDRFTVDGMRECGVVCLCRAEAAHLF